MANFIKLHMFAVNYDNGGKLDDPIASKDFTERERYFAEPLKGEVISLYEWCQYFFFAGSSCFGLATEYREFDEYMNKKGGHTNVPVEKLWAPACIRFGHVLLMVV